METRGVVDLELDDVVDLGELGVVARELDGAALPGIPSSFSQRFTVATVTFISSAIFPDPIVNFHESDKLYSIKSPLYMSVMFKRFHSINYI